MKISKRVHLMASGWLGCSMSHPNDCNVYALRCSDRYLVIDTGVGVGYEDILRELHNDEVRPSQIEAILLTHGHLDHAGGAHCLHEILQAPVFASQLTADALQSGNEEAISLADAKRAGLYPPEVKLKPCSVDRVLSHRATFQVGDCRITALHTPGHSSDMLSYLVETSDETLLFCGDTVFHGGTILLQDAWDCDLRAYTASLRSLGEIAFDGLYPGHGLWSVRDGSRHIEKCLSFIHRMLIPPSLLSGVS
jgi:glyoxylase-like metal-dependent hydrolase (beta-lactamase superfamily II)